jgi:hypothetical protein
LLFNFDFPAQNNLLFRLVQWLSVLLVNQVMLMFRSGYLTYFSDEALYRTLDYTSFGLASGVSVSYLQKCQLYEAL